MPVTRNRLSNQRSTATAAAPAPATTTTNAATITNNNNNGINNNLTASAIADHASSEIKSQIHNSTDNSASPDEQTRQLRDRNSLIKTTNNNNNSSQQQQNQLDADRNATPELDGLNLSKKSKVAQPTRVLPRRSSTRPQSLLLRDSPNHKAQPSEACNGSAGTNHLSKKFKADGANATGDSDAPEPKSPKPSMRSTPSRLPTNCDEPLSANLDVSLGHNRLKDRHQVPSSNATSLLSSSTTIRSNGLDNAVQHVPPVSISLPRNDATNANNIAANILKRAGLMSTRAPLFEVDDLSTSSGAVNLSTRNRDHHQRVPTNVLPVEKRSFNILIAVTGSVASVKLVELIKKLASRFPQTFTNRSDNKTYEATISIRVLMTESAKHFVDRSDIVRCLGGTLIDVFDDADEWLLWQKMGDPVLHIELRKWADLCLIAPLDANTMAKIANGICDNLLTCVVRAWDVAKRLIYCPAMNVHMYEHPITREHLCKLQSYGYMRIDCIEKRLACGDVGLGAMASVDTIVERVVENLIRPIPKLISPIKSIMNQPTYPIMSTSATPSTSRNSSAMNLMDRYRPESQIDAQSTRVSRNSLSTMRNGISPGTSLLSGPKHNNNLTMGKNLPHLKNINNNINASSNVAANQLGARPNLVKSLKNLKAVNSDLSISFNDDILDKDDDDNDELYADANLDLDEDDSNYEIDPSRMLEQSLITDDDNSFGNEARRGSLQLTNNSSASNTPNWSDSFQRTDANFTPLFNTSKFLTMCYVKERNCFNCAICKNDYKNRKSMSRHLREQHVQGNIYKCIPCDVGFKRREKLIKHNRDKHSS